MIAAADSLTARARAVRAVLADPRAVAALLGLRVGGRAGAGVLVACPWHDEDTPSCSVQPRPDGLGVHCFGCDRGGSVLDVIAARSGLAMRGADFATVVGEAERLAALTPPPAERPAAPTPPRRPPSPAAVAALWGRCQPATHDPDAAAWCVRRGLEAGDIEARDLARALPAAEPLPSWACSRGGNWRTTGHRLVLPTYNATGTLVGLRARYVGEDATSRKELAPCGGACGLFADALARRVLTGAIDTPVAVVIAEGGPDYLTWATLYSDADEGAPAVLGVYAGAWDSAVATRLPAVSRVLLRLHDDKAGRRYAAEVRASFVGRHVALVEGQGRP